MTNRAIKALEVVQSGGAARSGLRSNYHGHSKQAFWFVDASGEKVKGLGFSTLQELIDAGLVVRDFDYHYGSTCERRWVAA